MNANTTNRYQTGIAPGRNAGSVRRAGAVRFSVPRRLGERRHRATGGAPCPPPELLSIEEAIARFVDANPPQLYRGGA